MSVIYREIAGLQFGIDASKSSSLLCEPSISEKTGGDFTALLDLIYSANDRYLPLAVTWELTDNCNFSCPFCYIHNRASSIQNVDDEAFLKIESDLRCLIRRGLLFCYLSGGEALLHPRFIAIYKFLKSNGIFVVLLSNLSLLEQTHLTLFKELPPYRVTTSIYSLDPKRFSEITGSHPQLCNKVLSNVETLLSMGINVTCQTPVNKLTITEVPAIAEWCFQRGIPYSFNDDVSDGYDGSDIQHYRVDSKSFEFLKSKTKVIKKPKSTVSIQQDPTAGYKYNLDCVAGKFQMTWGYDYSIRPCFHIFSNKDLRFSVKDGMDTALDAMTRTIEELKLIPIKGCTGCEARSFCNTCSLLLEETGANNKRVEHKVRSECPTAKRRMKEWAEEFQYNNSMH